MKLTGRIIISIVASAVITAAMAMFTDHSFRDAFGLFLLVAVAILMPLSTSASTVRLCK